jgi:hypothetical protein
VAEGDPVSKRIKKAGHLWFTPVLGRLIPGGDQQGQIVHESLFQNDHRKMDWRCGSSGTAPTLQVFSPEFRPKSHQ